MDDNDKQRIFNIIAILTERLGGEVTISETEIESAPNGTVTSNPDHTITVKIESSDGR